MNETWNAKTCLSKDWGNLEGTNTTAEDDDNNNLQCPPVWDGFTCWGPTPAGKTASAGCPSFKGSDISKSAFRICNLNGVWLDRDGTPNAIGWTNYTPCLTPEIREILRRLGTNDDAQLKFKIAENTRILEFVGLSLSLAALLLSLFIFYYFRTLRNSRTRLHRHLFIAMVIQVAIRLTVYTDQAIIRSLEEKSLLANDSRKMDMNPVRRGIDNTPVLCEASYVSLEYARTAMFMWMFVEGLFLHNMITVTVFEEKLSPLVYPVIGWIIPIPLTVAWAIVTHLHYGSATCWWGYNFTLYFWILEGPRLAVLMVNLAFLLNILRVLVMKLRQSNSSETQQALKTVKAALVLLPLLGISNLFNILDAPLEKTPFQFALWSYTTHLLTSTQGLILAILYCFRNGEVQMAIRKFVRLRILGNSKHIILAKRPIPLSALDNPSLFNGDSGGDSQTQNLNQSQRTMTKISARSGHITHHQLNHLQQMQKQSAKIPPLVVRSYRNGVLKQSTVKIDPQSRNIPRHHNHRICNEMQYRDLRQPLLRKSFQYDPTPTIASSPHNNMSIPVASSSAASASVFYQNMCNESSESSGGGANAAILCHDTIRGNVRPPQDNRMQVCDWGRLIPDLFRRQSSSENQVDDVVLSSRQKESSKSSNNNNTAGITEQSTVDYGESEAEENFSEDDDEFVSVEMNQDSFDVPCRTEINSEKRQMTIDNDEFDDLQYDNEDRV